MASSLRKKRVSIISLSERMKIPANRPKAWYGCRHTQVLLMCLCLLCCYAIRVTMSVAIEAMTNASTANMNFEEYDWDESVKRLILSSFFWGYVCTQIPGSIIALQWSAKKLFATTLIICGLVTILVPVLAHYWGWKAVCAARVIAGLAQGNVLPILHTLLSRWVPPDERGRLGSFVYSGGWVGNVISLLSSGYLSASSIGWPGCFYTWGSICVLCGVAVYVIGKDSPSEHPTIPLDEKEYIEISLGMTEIIEKPPTPWIPILTSLPVWALLVAQCAQNWGFWMLLTEIPSYMTSIMGFDIKENGMATALPYLMAWIFSFPISYVSDLCIKRNIVTTQASRKICNTFGHWIPAFALIGLGYVSKDQRGLAETILVVAIATNIAIYCGHNVNHMDLSPNFAGTLMGFTNSAANICSLLAPLVAGWLAPDASDVLQWRRVFFLSASIYLVGNLIFILFGTSKIQAWNDGVKSRRDNTLDDVSKTPTVATIQELREIEKIP